MTRLNLKIADGHPATEGHFPGNPIIPGALLLAEVLRCIEGALGQRFAACNVRNAKFHFPVRPGNDVEIEYSCSPHNEIIFQCAVSGKKVLSGAISATVNA